VRICQLYPFGSVTVSRLFAATGSKPKRGGADRHAGADKVSARHGFRGEPGEIGLRRPGIIGLVEIVEVVDVQFGIFGFRHFPLLSHLVCRIRGRTGRIGQAGNTRSDL
jgi:hypothetical protein